MYKRWGLVIAGALVGGGLADIIGGHYGSAAFEIILGVAVTIDYLIKYRKTKEERI